MYHGCDVWLNNPRRPLEACGTSGMKAALNGALNCCILDGWWDECYDGEQRLGDRLGRRRRRHRPTRPARGDQPVRAARARDRAAVLRPRRRRRAGRLDRQDEGQLALARPVRHRGAHGARLHHRALRAGRGQRDDDARRRRRTRARRWPPGSSTSSTAWAEVKVRRHRRRHRCRSRGRRSETCVRMSSSAASTPPRSRCRRCTDPIDSAGSFVDTPASGHLVARPATARSRATYAVGEAGPYGVTVRAIPRHERPDQPDGDGPGRLGRLDPLGRLRAGELGLAGAVLQEAAHADLAVVGVEHALEQVPLQLQRRPAAARRGRRRPPA